MPFPPSNPAHRAPSRRSVRTWLKAADAYTQWAFNPTLPPHYRRQRTDASR